MDSIKRAWRGEEKLWKVFWLYGVLASIALVIFRILVNRVIISAPLWNACGALILAYNIWLLVAVWRCAFNTDRVVWGYLGRILVVIKLISAIAIFALDVFVSGVMPVMMPETKNLVDQTIIQIQKGEENCDTKLKGYIDAGGKDIEGYRKKCRDDNATNETNSLINNIVLQGCQKSMTDFAQQHGADPQKYIAQNQAWLQQCVQDSAKIMHDSTPPSP